MIATPFTPGGLPAPVLAFARGQRLGVLADRIALGVVLLVFVMAAGLLAAALRIPRSARREKARREAAPDEPWSWRDDWCAGRARGQRERLLALSWTSALAWNAFALAPLPAFLRGPLDGLLVVWVPLPLLGAMLLAWAVRSTVRLLRFGHTFVQLDAVPVSLGGRFGGAVVARLPRSPRSVHLTLSCEQVSTRGTGRAQSSSRRIWWQGRREVAAGELLPGPRGSTYIPIAFDVPLDELPTTAGRSSTVRWLLRAQVDVRGVGLDEVYEIPVFETAESRRREERESADGARTPPVERPPRPTVVVSRAPDGAVVYDFGVGRSPGAVAVAVLLLLVFGALEALLMSAPVPVILPVVFGVVVALVAWIAIGLCLTTTRVVVARGQLTVVRSSLGLRRARSWRAGDLFWVACETRWGDDPGDAARHDLIASGGVGDEIVLAAGLRDEQEAEWVAQEIRRELGLPEGDEEGRADEDDDEDAEGEDA